jgi:hypothetical protein
MLSSIPTLPESKEITLGSIQYIAKHNELLQSIVFNFIEYLTSTLCINLHLGYYCTQLPPSSSLSCASPLYLDSDYFSISVLDPQSSDLKSVSLQLVDIIILSRALRLLLRGCRDSVLIASPTVRSAR